MRDVRRYLKWCLGQGRGIKLTKPSDNLVKAYLRKSRNALKSMDVNMRAGISEWGVSASYYAKYFAVYALLLKVGVKCQIHDCTITLFSYLFSDNVPRQVIQELRKSKEDRIETQYYTGEVKVNQDQLMKQTKDFVLEIEKTMDSLSSERIALLQATLKKLISESKGE